jgi:competence protein ComEA
VLIAALGLRAAGHFLGSGTRRAYQAVPVLVVDPNTVPPGVLGALPHVGPALVKRLVEQREIRPFDSTADLRRRVRGLGPATLARLAPHLWIKPRPEQTPEPEGPRIVSAPSSPKLAQGPRGLQTE